MIEIALKYAKKGWRVIPIRHKDKIPMISNWVEEATTEEATIRKWFKERRNIGIATGERSGFWVLDIDGEEGADSLRELEAKYGELPATIIQITGSGGYHYLFKYDERVKTGSTKVKEGIDIRTDGNQIVVYPSIHPNGKRYEWEVSSTSELAPAPEWLIGEITKRAKEQRERVDVTEKLTSGNRNDKLYRVACKYINEGIAGQALEGLIHGLNKERCDPELDKEEVDKLIDSAHKHKPTKDVFPEEERTIDELLERPQKRGLEYYEQSFNREGLLGYKLGQRFKDLEKKMDGIQPGMYLVGAVANVGKTTWLLNLAKDLIKENDGLQVLFFSIDDHFRKIYFRLLALESNEEINTMANIGEKVRLNKSLSEEQRSEMFAKAENAKLKTATLLKDLILLDETDGNTVEFVKSTVEKTYLRNQKLIVMADNFHKIRTPNITGSAKERFTHLSEEMKALSNRYDLPLIMTVELRKLNHTGPPVPDDLKETVDLHYDCDVTFMLHSESERKDSSGKVKEIDGQMFPVIDVHVQKNKVSDFKGKIEYVLIPKKATYFELNYVEKTHDEPCPF